MDDLILDSPETGFEPIYAGFWERFAAAFIDGLITIAITYIPSIAVGVTGSDTLVTIMFVFGYIASMLYFPIMTSSDKQATVGKQALGLKVTNMRGHRISFLNALGRYLGKIISAMILLIGYIMAAFTDQKQALHDIMASTLVVKERW